MADRRDDPEPGDPASPDQAVFAPARVPRGRTPRSGLALALVVGGLALAGVVGATGGPPAPAPRFAQPDPTAVGDAAEGVDVAAIVEAPWRMHPGVGEPFATMAPTSSAPPTLRVEARSSGRHLYVHGDVFTPGTVVVVVSIRDIDDRALEVRSVDLPGGSTAFRTAPNDRFALAFEVDGWPATQVAWVMANAYDQFGNRIESVRYPLALSTGHERWRSGAGM